MAVQQTTTTLHRAVERSGEDGEEGLSITTKRDSGQMHHGQALACIHRQRMSYNVYTSFMIDVTWRA